MVHTIFEATKYRHFNHFDKSADPIFEFSLLGSNQKIESGSGQDEKRSGIQRFGGRMNEQEAGNHAVAVIDNAVESFLAALEEKEIKLAVGDVLRLLELRKQFAKGEVREVEVRWVEADPDPSVTNS